MGSGGPGRWYQDPDEVCADGGARVPVMGLVCLKGEGVSLSRFHERSLNSIRTDPLITWTSLISAPMV